MPLKVSPSRVLNDALAYPESEHFEHALGRSVRRHGGDYEDYANLIMQVRDTARDRKLDLRDAARWLANQP